MNTDSMRILIVDDDPAFSSMIAEYLRDRGHTPITVEDGDEMRKEMERGDVDLVLPVDYAHEVALQVPGSQRC